MLKFNINFKDINEINSVFTVYIYNSVRISDYV